MLFQVPYTGGGQIRSVFYVLQSWGFVDALLPFLLIFILLFAILQKIELFKEGDEPDRKINGIISFAIAALVVIPHITRSYPPNADPITIINSFLPSATILLFAIFLVLALLGFVGGKIPNTIVRLIGLVALIILSIVIIKAAFPAFAPQWSMDPNTQALLVALLTMGLVGWFVIRKPPEGEEKTLTKRLEELFG